VDKSHYYLHLQVHQYFSRAIEITEIEMKILLWCLFLKKVLAKHIQQNQHISLYAYK